MLRMVALCSAAASAAAFVRECRCSTRRLGFRVMWRSARAVITAPSSQATSATPLTIDDRGRVVQRYPTFSTGNTGVSTGSVTCIGSSCVLATLSVGVEGCDVFNITLGRSSVSWDYGLANAVVINTAVTANGTVLVTLGEAGDKHICEVLYNGKLNCLASLSDINGLLYGGGAALCGDDVLYVAIHTAADEPDVVLAFDFRSGKLYPPVNLQHGAPTGLTCDDSTGTRRLVGVKFEPSSNALWYTAVDPRTGAFTTLQEVAMLSGATVDNMGAYDVASGTFVASLVMPDGLSILSITNFTTAPVLVPAKAYVSGISTQ